MEILLPLLLTSEYDCAYLPDRQSRSLVIGADAPMSAALYGLLVKQGFRRSGQRVYRPHCNGCNACMPIRVPVRRFQANRSQRRNLKANADLTATVLPSEYRQEHYHLYRRYLHWRHADGRMADSSPGDYREFFFNLCGVARLVEFRAPGRLAAVAAIDRLDDGLSAVYTFYEPDMVKRGLGDYAVLWSIRHALELQLDYVYLGYWIAACRKMAYKIRYRPFELHGPADADPSGGYAWREMTFDPAESGRLDC